MWRGFWFPMSPKTGDMGYPAVMFGVQSNCGFLRWLSYAQLRSE